MAGAHPLSAWVRFQCHLLSGSCSPPGSQEPDRCKALTELYAAGTNSHWMWFTISQLVGFGPPVMLGPHRTFTRSCNEFLIEYVGPGLVKHLLNTRKYLRDGSSNCQHR